MPDEPSPIESRTAAPSARNLPLWFVAAMLVFSLAVGAAGVWWYFATDHRPRIITISTPPGSGISERGGAEGAPGEPLPLPVGEVPATLVSLELKSASPHAAFAALAQTSHTRITLLGGSSDPDVESISAIYRQQPFWTVLLDLCKKAGCVPLRQYGGGRTITLERRSQAADDPTAIDGPFLLRLTRIRRTQRPTTQGQPCDISALLAWEPGAMPLGLALVPVTTEAVDELGHSLAIDTGVASIIGRGDPLWQQRVSVPLYCPPNAGHRIAHLAGYFRAVVKGPHDLVLEIPNPLDASPRRVTVEGVVLEFLSMKREGSDDVAWFAVPGQLKDPRIFPRFAPHLIRLVDNRGKDIRRIGGDTGYRKGVFRFSGRFHPSASSGAPAKLVVAIPTELKEARIPFDFKDLPLP